MAAVISYDRDYLEGLIDSVLSVRSLAHRSLQKNNGLVVAALRDIKSVLYETSNLENNISKLEEAIEVIQDYGKENSEFECKFILIESRKLCDELKERFQKEEREEEKEEAKREKERELKNAFLPFGITNPVEADRKILGDLQRVLKARNEALRIAKEGRREDGFAKLQKGIESNKEEEIAPLARINNYARSLEDSNPTKQALTQFIRDTTALLRQLQLPPLVRSSSNSNMAPVPGNDFDPLKSAPCLGQRVLENPVTTKKEFEVGKEIDEKKDVREFEASPQNKKQSVIVQEQERQGNVLAANVVDTVFITAIQSKENDAGTLGPSSENADAESSTNFSLMLKALSTFAQTTEGKIVIGVACVLLLGGIAFATWGAAGFIVAGAAIASHVGLSVGGGSLVLGIPTGYGLKHRFFGTKQTQSDLGISPSTPCAPH